jgi:hypothetical protein
MGANPSIAMATRASTAADVLVIFGITEDLAKKMTFRSLLDVPPRVEPYKPGSWGPVSCRWLVAPSAGR